MKSSVELEESKRATQDQWHEIRSRFPHRTNESSEPRREISVAMRRGGRIASSSTQDHDNEKKVEKKEDSMNMTMNRTAMAGPEAEVVKTHLQSTLVDLLDLTLQAKQAHWNVVGPRFRSVHLQLDDLVADVRGFSDTVAERIVALGDPAEGSAAAVHEHTKLDPFPANFIVDEEVVTLVVGRLEVTCNRIRRILESVQDPVSHDLLVQILGKLEEQMWMFHAQLQAA